jgi:hypothetical protein
MLLKRKELSVHLIAHANVHHSMGAPAWLESSQSMRTRNSLTTCTGVTPDNLRPAFGQHHPFNVDVYLSYAPDQLGHLIWSVPAVPLAQRNLSLHHEVSISAAFLEPVCSSIPLARPLIPVCRFAHTHAHLTLSCNT